MAQKQQNQSDLQQKKKAAQKAKDEEQKKLLKLLGTGSARSAGEAIRKRQKLLEGL